MFNRDSLHELSGKIVFYMFVGFVLFLLVAGGFTLFFGEPATGLLLLFAGVFIGAAATHFMTI